MTEALTREAAAALRAQIGFLRDLGIHDFYRRGMAPTTPAALTAQIEASAGIEMPAFVPLSRPLEHSPVQVAGTQEVAIQEIAIQENAILEPAPSELTLLELSPPEETGIAPRKAALPPSMLPPMPSVAIAPPERAAALAALQAEIGDCTRCPLGFAGRQKVVFGDGDPNARLLFVGEGPGADEDAQGVPFIGKAGQLLNNMIGAMGLKREEVYIANIVKCRPPANRVPEPVEAHTCVRFLFEQIGIVRPEIIVALGSTAATYLLGAKSPLGTLRGRIHDVNGTRLVVTYHPAFLLRDPRQKKEAWADLQVVMRELASPAS